MRVTPNRDFGNCTAILGDSKNGYIGRIDDLLILTTAEPPSH